MKVFTADFETTTDPLDCRVWAFALCEVGNTDNFIYGNNITSFIDFCKNKKENYKIWFHNLKFDGEYIFSYLLKNGYENTLMIYDIIHLFIVLFIAFKILGLL